MNVVIAAGGTGGHVYPAVALAEEFCRRDPMTVMTLVRTGKELEDTMLRETAFRLETLSVQGVVGRGRWASLCALLLVPRAIIQAMHLLRSLCADLVIGTGGYISPPVVIAAWLLGIHRVLLEPNAVPGVANRMLGPFAHRTFLSFNAAEPYFNRSKTRVVGTPLRKEFVTGPPEPASGDIRTILIIGGSQGARAINTAVIDALAVSRTLCDHVMLIHQTGDEDYERVHAAYAAAGVQATVSRFLVDMSEVLHSADLVISRCGALTLAELAACGKPAILIPFPFAAHRHQEKNARVVEAAGAAIVLTQDELSGPRLVQEIEILMTHPDHVKQMAAQSAALRRTNSAEAMVQECCRLVNGK
ncbi:MAG: undecaprenyldiphospho-muramoylpentapeptide beta-N-acetylglucosaminyltransferase [Nitrospirales bacterium]|nr:undecaprenyldiphospho-muramoylpentapeptide beta-N-acetylglucosaminyltransferase [Nitrospirales bacterium]